MWCRICNFNVFHMRNLQLSCGNSGRIFEPVRNIVFNRIAVYYIGWILGIDDLIEVVNEDSVMHVGKLWVAIIKYILPCVIFIVWTFGIIDLIKTGGFLELAVDVVITLSILIASVMLTKFEDYK